MLRNNVIALIPLDERPVNTRYPEMLAEIAGATVMLPPEDIRGSQRIPADLDAVAEWLKGAAPWAEAGVVVSTEFLAYGNLINSRISSDSVADALARLRVLDEIRNADSAEPVDVYAFSVITRVSNADDCVEEPEYWATHGTRFYRYSALLHKRDAGVLTDDEQAALADLEASLPEDLRRDWLRRRLRNHTVNLALIDLLMRDRLSFLLITSDDTSPWGTPSREKRWLESWLDILGPSAKARTMMHPGADEVGSALVARLIAQQRLPHPPRICPIYAVPGGEEITAPYEDRAVRLTVEGQIRACGGELSADPDEADILLGVLTPSPPRRREFDSAFAAEEREARAPFYDELFARLGKYQVAGKPVAIGDVVYPNGSDPLAIDMLLDPECPLDPSRLAAYGAWNTAGNTLGVVVAQAVCSLLIDGKPDRVLAQRRFLAHRFLEDWGYQAVVRREAREWTRAQFGTSDPDPNNILQVAATSSAIHTGLKFALARLQLRGIGEGFAVDPDRTSLPWNRTFEVDFELKFTPKAV